MKANPANIANVANVADAARGLLRAPKTLPSWLLYDDVGCALYEKITELPEYYLTRTETAIFGKHADAIVQCAGEGAARIALAELGAGLATKTEILLEAAVRAQGACTFLACDIAPESVAAAGERIKRNLPRVDVRPVVGTHVDAGPAIAALGERQVLLYIGSSIGNYADDDAIALLRSMRAFLRDDAALVLGTDLKKDPRVLVAAYDDAQGVTAAFSKNILARLNRELAADFDLARFEHVAVWNEATSNIEVYLESTAEQRVHLRLDDHFGAHHDVRDGVEIAFARGERIHTEICAKYDLARVDAILRGAGFARARTFTDDDGRFGVHVARVR